MSLLGPPPLLDGEDAGAYDALYRHIRTAVAPRDVLEEIWARDAVDNLSETLRLRRLKVGFMRASAHEGLNKLMMSLKPGEPTGFIVKKSANRERDAVKEVDGLLRQAGLDQEAIAAQTLALKLDTIERIERMIMQTEGRRNMIKSTATATCWRNVCVRPRPISKTRNSKRSQARRPPNEAHGARAGQSRKRAPQYRTEDARGKSRPPPGTRCDTGSPFPSQLTRASPTRWRAWRG